MSQDSFTTASISSYNEYSSDDEPMNHSKYLLGFCDLHHTYFHGPMDPNDCDPSIEGHYLFMTPTTIDNGEQVVLQRVFNLMRTRQIHGAIALNHPIIRNYKNYVAHPNHIQPQIVETITHDNGYTTAIIKTHYLRLLQRKWKKIVAQRKETIKHRKNPKALYHRSIYGKWPSHCANYY